MNAWGVENVFWILNDSVIPASRRQRLEKGKFKISLGFNSETCLKGKKKDRKEKDKASLTFSFVVSPEL